MLPWLRLHSGHHPPKIISIIDHPTSDLSSHHRISNNKVNHSMGAANTPGVGFPQVVRVAGYITLWIVLSATVILYNKYLLSVVLPYPITLTMWHMTFCSAAAHILVRLDMVEHATMTSHTFWRAVVPISALFAGTLWLGNAAYLYLSVAFIQMLKALMPVAVFIVGCSVGTESFRTSTLLNMIVISAGVAISAYGELHFVLVGILLQLASIATESTRLCLTQILLQDSGLKLTPITMLYYVAPCSVVFLLLPFAFIEAPTILSFVAKSNMTPFLWVSNALAAFFLNISTFLLIGTTSALTLNVSGVIKDWMLIGMSSVAYSDPVTPVSLFGYFISFLAVFYYNYHRIGAAPSTPKSPTKSMSKPISAAVEPLSTHKHAASTDASPVATYPALKQTPCSV